MVVWLHDPPSLGASRALRAGLMALGGLGMAVAVLSRLAGWPAASVAETPALSWPSWRRPPAPSAPVAPAASPLAGWIVAVDPGHGGADGGVRHGDLLEKDVNLAVAEALQDLLERTGARVVMTRSGDQVPLERPRTSLDRRLALAAQAEAAVYVSIHANSYPDPRQFGAQTFFDPNSAESRRLATLIQQELVVAHPDNYRSALAADFYVLRNSPCPAVLVEVGFLSNPDDRRRLAQPQWRARLAAAILRGLERFAEGEMPDSRRPALRPPGPPAGFIHDIYPNEPR